MLLLAGCNPNSQSLTPTPGSVGYFAINEIGLGSNGYVSLTNITSQPAALAGLYLCQGTQCWAFPEATVSAGATARVGVGDGKGLEGLVADHATIGDLKPADGEVALFASNKFDDPQALLAYLQWGSTPHKLTDLAVKAGLWLKESYAPTSENATRLYRQPDTGLWLFE